MRSSSYRWVLVVALCATLACRGTSQEHDAGDDGAPSGGDGETGGQSGSGGTNALGGTGASGGRAGSTASGGTATGGTASGGDGTGGAPGGEGGAADTGGTAGASAAGAGTGGGGAGGLAGAAGATAGTGAGMAGSAGAGTAGAGGCGDYDQPCCARTPGCDRADAACAPRSRTDSTRICRRCGTPGGPCCGGQFFTTYAPRICDGGCCAYRPSQSTWECLAVGETCTIGGACQADGSCADCGRLEQGCCNDAFPNSLPWCSVPFTTCVGMPQARTCEPCGRENERCCIDTERAFGSYACVAPLECEQETCVQP